MASYERRRSGSVCSMKYGAFTLGTPGPPKSPSRMPLDDPVALMRETRTWMSPAAGSYQLRGARTTAERNSGTPEPG